ncbi:MAG: hypothetical protein ACRERU_22890 [Methylococcales bacterium]
MNVDVGSGDSFSKAILGSEQRESIDIHAIAMCERPSSLVDWQHEFPNQILLLFIQRNNLLVLRVIDHFVVYLRTERVLALLEKVSLVWAHIGSETMNDACRRT